jgi:hypothetical protein
MRGRILGAAGVIALTLSLGLGPAGASAFNQVTAVTSGVGPRTQERAALAYSYVSSPLVFSYNRADARSSFCRGCKSEAAAFEVLLYSGNPWLVKVDNSANATQVACTFCITTAYAAQIVVGGPGVTLTQAGKDGLAALRAEANTLVRSLDGPALIAALNGLKDKIIAHVFANTTTSQPQGQGAVQVLTYRKTA